MRAKEGGKETTGETSGRSCFQDGGKFNGGRVFRNEFRPVHVATLENKIACPHPVCEEAVFLQRAGLQQHYRIRHPEVIFLPKIEDAAGCLMQKLHARETRNILLELFEKRSGQVVFTY